MVRFVVVLVCVLCYHHKEAGVNWRVNMAPVSDHTSVDLPWALEVFHNSGGQMRLEDVRFWLNFCKVAA
jgi:hypothetical protein